MLMMLAKALLLFRYPTISRLGGPTTPTHPLVFLSSHYCNNVINRRGAVFIRTAIPSFATLDIQEELNVHPNDPPRRGRNRRNRRNRRGSVGTDSQPPIIHPDSDDKYSLLIGGLSSPVDSKNRPVVEVTKKEKKKASIMAKRTRSKASKVYAVAVGRKPGIYISWAACEAQVKGFANARFKSFPTQEEAQTFIIRNGGAHPTTATISAGTSMAQSSSLDGGVMMAVAPSASSLPPEMMTRRIAPTSADTLDSLDEVPKKKKAAKRVRKTEVQNPVHRDDDVQSAGNPMDPVATSSSSSSTTPSNKTPSKLWFHINFDGGARGNPHGVSGSGTLVVTRRFFNAARAEATTTAAAAAAASAKKTTTTIERSTTRIRTYLGYGKTNNEAEYTGAICGLEYVLTTLQKLNGSTATKAMDVSVVLQGDSDLVIRQLKGLYKCNSPNLKPLLQKAKTIVRDIDNMVKSLNITYEHVYRKDNSEADALANEAMDAQRSWTTGCESGDDDCTSSQAIIDQGDQNNNNNNDNVDEGDQNDKLYV